jgi:hypothetical protein
MVRHALRSIALSAILALVIAPAAGARSTAVDVDALLPPPPPGATCASVGNDTIRCDTFKDFDLDHEPVFEVHCGTVYETSADHRDGIRWYRGGVLVKRHVDADLDGFWSVDPTATDSGVRLFAAWASTSTWTVPGDDSTVQERLQGVLGRVNVGGRPLYDFSGQNEPDGSYHGLARDLDFSAGTGPGWASLVAALCD